VGGVSTGRYHNREDESLLSLSSAAAAGRSDGDEPDYYCYYCSNTPARNDPVGPAVVAAPAIAWYDDNCQYGRSVLGPICPAIAK
jgi:hypothetical protein